MKKNLITIVFFALILLISCNQPKRVEKEVIIEKTDKPKVEFLGSKIERKKTHHFQMLYVLAIYFF